MNELDKSKETIYKYAIDEMKKKNSLSQMNEYQLNPQQQELNQKGTVKNQTQNPYKNYFKNRNSGFKACNFRYRKQLPSINATDQQTDSSQLSQASVASLLSVTPPKIIHHIEQNYSAAYRNRSYRVNQNSPRYEDYQCKGLYTCPKEDSILLDQILKKHRSQKLVVQIAKPPNYLSSKLLNSITKKQIAFKKIQNDISHQFEYRYLLNDENIQNVINQLTEAYRRFLSTQCSTKQAIQLLDHVFRLNRYLKSIFIDSNHQSLSLRTISLAERVLNQEVYYAFLKSSYTLCQITNHELKNKEEKDKKREIQVAKFHMRLEEPILDSSYSKHFQETNFKNIVQKGFFVNPSVDSGLNKKLKEKSTLKKIPSFTEFVYDILIPDLKQIIAELEIVSQNSKESNTNILNDSIIH